MEKRIRRREIDTQNIDLPADTHPVLKRIYASRGITDVKDIDKQLTTLIPFQQLMGIDLAVERLVKALRDKEQILIVGDFDADGATSSALAVCALRDFGAQNVEYLVPNRFAYGYGLTPEIVEVAARWKPKLIITVDNGISSIDGVDTANKLGIDVIVTDHHLPGKEVPNAVAIVNPNQSGDEFPCKNLAGVGVIFYVMLALRRHLLDINWFADHDLAEPNMSECLDLVALGTYADVVTLDQNNRTLVYQGLRRIRAGKCRPGILALLEVAKRKRANLKASDLGFGIGPRLNAAGRLDDMALGIECLLSQDMEIARRIATELDQLNQERRNIEANMQQQAMLELTKLHLDNTNLPLGICMYDESWHQGVIGILAGRIKDRMHRPVIAFAKSDEKNLKGSARSVTGLHIRDVLDAIATQHPNLITKFGGHSMAAGLSLELENFQQFSKAFDEEVSKHLDKDIFQGEIVTDGELEPEYCTLEVAELLRTVEPWGQGFPEPLFEGNFKIVQQRIVGGRHLKLLLSQENSTQMIDAIAFNVDENQWPNYRCENIYLVYRLDVNEYAGNRRLQLLVELIRPQ